MLFQADAMEAVRGLHETRTASMDDVVSERRNKEQNNTAYNIYRLRYDVCYLTVVLSKDSAQRAAAVVQHGMLPALCYMVKYMELPSPLETFSEVFESESKVLNDHNSEIGEENEAAGIVFYDGDLEANTPPIAGREVANARITAWHSACQALLAVLEKSQEARIALPGEVFESLVAYRQAQVPMKLYDDEVLGEEMAVLFLVGGL
jgi:hypothetical protein